MEPNDEVVERQKLVDVETEEDVTNSAPKSAPTPASPMAVPKINVSLYKHMYVHSLYLYVNCI